MATPVIALTCDGALYDVAALESVWGIAHDYASADFHARVVAARCAGLAELDARLRSGPRPSEARLLASDFVPLAPCDPTRSAHFQLGSHARPDPLPSFHHGDSRALVGDAQPVPIPPGQAPTVQAGLAVVLADDLWRSGAREAAQAILGVTLVLDWAPGPCQIGPELLVRPAIKDLLALGARLSCGGSSSGGNRASLEAPVSDPRLHPAEALAYLSQHVHLAAGDVVGLGAMRGARLQLAFGERVTLDLPKVMQLSGWATEGPPAVSWTF